MIEKNLKSQCTIIECKKCGKPFAYEVCDWGYPGGKEREYALCPYCKTEGASAVTNGVIYTYKLDDDGHPIETSKG